MSLLTAYVIIAILGIIGVLAMLKLDFAGPKYVMDWEFVPEDFEWDLLQRFELQRANPTIRKEKGPKTRAIKVPISKQDRQLRDLKYRSVCVFAFATISLGMTWCLKHFEIVTTAGVKGTANLGLFKMTFEGLGTFAVFIVIFVCLIAAIKVLRVK